MDELAGYRVLRAAARGSRSRLFVGFDRGDTVVLKVCGASDPRVAREVAALDRAAGDHVVALLDVAADDTGTVLVLERLTGGGLAELLERRTILEPGEVVTILAPIATTLERLHVAGVSHGALSLDAIAFRESGEPVLVGFGAAELFSPGAPEVVRESVAGVVADREALRALVGLVLGRVTGGGAAAAAVRRVAQRMLAPTTREADRAPTPEYWADALYAVAAPSAVVLDDVAESEPAEPVPRGAVPPDVVEEEAVPDTLPPWLVALLPDGWRERVVRQVNAVLAVWRGWSISRRRLALGAAAGLLTVVLAVAVIPVSPSTVEASQVSEAAPPVFVEHTDDAPDDRLPDEPVDAAVVLLERRAECLRDLSVLCLDDVVQAGSAAQADDVAVVRAVLDGAEYPAGRIAPGEPILVERLGDSALLDLPAGSDPASVLMLRTTEGWRLRDYLEAPALVAETG